MRSSRRSSRRIARRGIRSEDRLGRDTGSRIRDVVPVSGSLSVRCRRCTGKNPPTASQDLGQNRWTSPPPRPPSNIGRADEGYFPRRVSYDNDTHRKSTQPKRMRRNKRRTSRTNIRTTQKAVILLGLPL